MIKNKIKGIYYYSSEDTCRLLKKKGLLWDFFFKVDGTQLIIKDGNIFIKKRYFDRYIKENETNRI